MKYEVRLKPAAEKALKKIPKDYYYRILVALSDIAINPFVGKKLEGEYRSDYTVRVWPYRIIYEIHKNELIVLVIRIGHRQGVY